MAGAWAGAWVLYPIYYFPARKAAVSRKCGTTVGSEHGGSELRSWIRTGPNFGPGMLVKSFLSAGVEIGPLMIDFEFPFSTRI